MEHIIINFSIVLIIILVYLRFIKNKRENLSMGTLTQLNTNNDIYYVGGDLYNPFTFWNMSTRRPYSTPYYIPIHKYFEDGMAMDMY